MRRTNNIEEKLNNKNQLENQKLFEKKKWKQKELKTWFDVILNVKSNQLLLNVRKLTKATSK